MSHDQPTANNTDRTPGELLLEEYLRSVGITSFEFERQFPGIAQRPDYTIPRDETLVLDVKDFRGEPSDFEAARAFGSFDPYEPIRLKIEEGRRNSKTSRNTPAG